MSAEKTPRRKRVHVRTKQYGIRLGGRLHRERFASAELGRQWQRKMREEFEAGKHGLRRALDPKTIDQVAERFLAARQLLATVGHDEYRLRHYVVPHFRGRQLHSITKGEWMELLGDGEHKQPGLLVTQYGLAPRTSNLVRVLVHTMYEFARKREECVSENPIHDIEPLHAPRKKFRMLETQAEISRYVQAARDSGYAEFHAFVLISLNTGLRYGNVATLKWRDVSLETNTINAHTKIDYRENRIVEGTKAHDNESHVVGISKALRKFLVEWKDKTLWAADDDFVCANQRTGGYLFRSKIWLLNERVCAEAQVPYINIHGLRHTYATHFLERGGNLHDLRHILNHSSVTVTELYAHNLRKRLAEQAEVMSVGACDEQENSAEKGCNAHEIGKNVLALRHG